MPGIDKSRIVGKDAQELDEFTCGICQDVYNQPVVASCCRQSYCSDCIAEWLSEHNTCPNDRKRLTSDGLLQSARIVLNLIDRMRIRCVFSGKGCPSVHSIAEDAEHTKNCKFTKCRQCGYSSSDADSNHHCIAYLLEVNLSLTEENQKMKAEIAELKEVNKQLLSSHYLLKEKNQVLKNNLDNRGQQDRATNEKKERWRPREISLSQPSQSLMTAIMDAKGVPPGVSAYFKDEPQWKNVITGICMDAINEFDIDRHTYDDFVSMIQTSLDQGGINEKWFVHVSQNRMQGGCNKINSIRLSFGGLYIVIWAIFKHPIEFQLR